MKSENRSQAFLRKRKMLLVLPLLVIPFLTMAFWSLGGGSSPKETVSSTGLNPKLPSPGLKKEEGMSKLSFYDKMQRDSAKLKEWMHHDPYYQRASDSLVSMPAGLQDFRTNTPVKFHPLNPSPFEASVQNPEEALLQKLSTLQKELATPKISRQAGKPDEGETNAFSAQTQKLQTMMEEMSSGGEEDPAIQQLSTTLDKILDIQHPERIKDKLKEKSLQQRGVVFTVEPSLGKASMSLLGGSEKGGGGFFGLENEEGDTTRENAIEAVIASAQTLVNGAVVTLRLLHDVLVNGRLIPSGTLVHGVAALNSERLEVDISSVRTGSSLFPVRLTVYDMDGLRGIYIPGAIAREVAKESADNSLQLLELSSMDPSLKAQIAATGIRTAKGLWSKKVKQVRVVVKAGHKVLLKNKAEGE